MKAGYHKMPDGTMMKDSEHKSEKRNYRKEYDNYHSAPEQKLKRASRNAARAMLSKGGVTSKGDGKDVDHKDGNPKNNKRSNLTVKLKAANRSFPRTASAKKAPAKKGTK